MRLNQLSDNEGARRPRKRLGRGIGSGLGKTAGRGGKGQTARSGGSIRPGFEGGQMPLYRKLPHRGFNNYNHREEIAVVNVSALGSLDASVNEVNAEVLATHGLIRAGEKTVKILGDGEISRALKVTAAKFSESAKAKIEAAGGTAEVID